VSTDCIFCKIASGDIPTELVREEPDYVAFRDLNPQAPTHILVIPREHMATVNEFSPKTADLAGKLLVEQLLLLSQGMIASGFETGNDTMLRQVMA